MLTESEAERVTAVLESLGTSDNPSIEQLAVLLVRLPRKPEALTEFLTRVTDDHPAVVPALRDAVRHFASLCACLPTVSPRRGAVGTILADILDSNASRSAKLDALAECGRQRDTHGTTAVRERILTESDPFVQATMASVIGCLGDSTDAPLLSALLDNPDPRVVANAVAAARKLHISLPAFQVMPLLLLNDSRVCTNALAILAHSNPDHVVAILPELLQRGDLAFRSSAAYLLGQLSRDPRALDILLDMLAHEAAEVVLKQVTLSLKGLAQASNASDIIPRLKSLRSSAKGYQLDAIQHLLDHIGVTDDPVPVETHRNGSPALPPEILAADVTLAPARVWGSSSTSGRRPTGKSATVRRTASTPQLPTRRWPPYALGILAATITIISLATLPRPDHTATAVRPPSQTRPGHRKPTIPAGSEFSSGKSSFSGSGAVVDRGPPLGSRVILDGLIVSVFQGRAIVRSGTRCYLLTSERAGSLQVGHPFKGVGQVKRVETGGLIHLELRGS